ncbi:hypothetical protein Dimus_008479, partial [Dionaea muscipula]
SSQRRVRDVGFDSRSPDPHTVALTWVSPSPTAPHFRRAPPSPGLLDRHIRSPSPLLSSSPDSEECGSIEEGVSPDPDVASSEVEILSEVAVGSRFSPLVVRSRSIPEVSVLLEGSISAVSSGSSTLSTTMVVLLCQDSIAAIVHRDDRMQLVLSESVCFSSSPSLDGPASVSEADEEVRRGYDGAVGVDEVPVVDSSGELLCTGSDMVSNSPDLLASSDVAFVDGRCMKLDLQYPVNPLLQPEAVVVDSDKPTVGVPFTDSVFRLPGGSVHRAATLPGGSVHRAASLLDGSVGGGPVSEEGRVLPVAREALRPQLTDWLRQPSSAPVEPASVVAGGGGPDGYSRGRSYVHVVQAENQPDLKDGRLISSSLLELSPIVEGIGMPEASNSPGSSTLSPTAAAIYCKISDVARGVDLVNSSSSSSLGGAAIDQRGGGVGADKALVVNGDEEDGVSGLGEVVSGQIRGATVTGVDGANDGAALNVDGEVVGCVATPVVSSDEVGSLRSPTVTLGTDLYCKFDSVNTSFPSCNAGAIQVAGVKVTEAISHLPMGSIVDTVVGGGFLNGEVQNLEYANSRADSLLPRISGVVGLCGGGVVSEEGRVLLVARGALRPQPADGLRQPLSPPVEPMRVVERPQPTDGLRQPHSSPVVPLSGADGGGGKDDSHGCRSYANVVQVAHPHLMWSYNSAKHRNFRVRSVVERMMREGMGTAEEDLRLDFPDFSGVVVQEEDLSPIMVLEPDLKASIDGCSLTKAKELDDQSIAPPVARGCAVALGSSVVSAVLSNGVDLELMAAVVPEILLPASVSSCAPELRVSVPASSRCAGSLEVAVEDRGCDPILGMLPEVSAHSDSGGDQAMGNDVDGLITEWVADFLVDVSGGDSECPMLSVSFVSPSLCADSVGDDAPLLTVYDGSFIGSGKVSEEGVASLAAREALRPSPTDGRRQPPLSPVEPVMVTGRGGLAPGAGGGLPSGGSGLATAGEIDYRRSRLAPPSGLQRREGCVDGWEDWLRTYSDPFACKEGAEIRNHRFLKKMENLAKTEDGELRERIGRRRSSRISSSTPHSVSDLGVGRASVDEIDASMGFLADEISAPPVFSELGFSRVVELQPIEEILESEDERDQMIDSVINSSLGRGKGSGLSVVAVSDCLEGDLTEVQGGLTPSMVSDALTGALDNDSCFDEVGGNEFSIVTILGSDSSTATVTSDSTMEHRASIDFVGAASVKVAGVLDQGGGEKVVVRQDDDLVVGGFVVDGQQVPLVVGVVLRLPSTDGRQQQPSQPADSSCPVAGSGHDGRRGARGEFGGVWDAGFSL